MSRLSGSSKVNNSPWTRSHPSASASEVVRGADRPHVALVDAEAREPEGQLVETSQGRRRLYPHRPLTEPIMVALAPLQGAVEEHGEEWTRLRHSAAVPAIVPRPRGYGR